MLFAIIFSDTMKYWNIKYLKEKLKVEQNN